ncbi:hypothetical protein IG193_07435 [Infirmifilum lucidum]|uniref:Sensory transduction regulator n=1 Tax=Infirmifilum lucidum TaxID=2776706 RepID=A0A7L9FG37_9CREN|nr:hypothetical protein [Infirmifilum lucidum]QOJ78581.1 hypothetical protein IG193_07435 [Infirmifilum lucidum]
MSGCQPEEVARRLSLELESKGYSNVISEDAKTIILYWCGGLCPTLLVRVEEEGVRVLIPLIFQEADIEQIRGVLEGFTPKPTSLEVIRVDGSLVGLEVNYAPKSCPELDYIEGVIDGVKELVSILRSEGRSLPLEADIIV